MRLLAFLQIVLLLTTSIFPEGRMLMSQSVTCSTGECDCSAELRRNGSCCCSSDKRVESDSVARCQQTGDHDSGVAESAGSCCARKTEKNTAAGINCAAKQTPVASNEQFAEVLITTVSACPCDSDSQVVWVSHMPRMLPVCVPAAVITWTQGLTALIDDQRRRKVDEPPTPPPNSTVC